MALYYCEFSRADAFFRCLNSVIGVTKTGV